MVTAYSKLTTEGETSVPYEIRRKLGLGPGSVLKWEEEGDRIVVRRVDAVPAGEPERIVSVGREAQEYPSGSSVERLFGIARRPDVPPLSVEEMDEAIGRHLAADDERIRKGEG